MKQIGSAMRRLEWKEKCDDISGFCNADVFPAVDYRAPEAGLYRNFHCESSVWLDGDRMGDRAGVGVRERRPAAGICDGWAGAVLRAVRSDDRGRAFLSELRASAVNPTTRSGEKFACIGRIPHPLPKNAKDGAPQKAKIAIPELRAAAVSLTARSGETFACGGGIPHPLLKDAKDGAPVKTKFFGRGMEECGGVC